MLTVTVAGVLILGYLVFTGTVTRAQSQLVVVAYIVAGGSFARLTRPKDSDPPVRKVDLRDASKADSDALYVIHEGAMREYVVQTWGAWDHDYQRAFWREHWFPGREVIEIHGEMAGFLDLEDREDHVWIGNIELHPRFQGQGIGTVILRDIQLDAAKRELGVRLQVLKVNPARRLYERLGFEVTGETDTHWPMAWGQASR